MTTYEAMLEAQTHGVEPIYVGLKPVGLEFGNGYAYYFEEEESLIYTIAFNLGVNYDSSSGN